jgi:hypothetical protein
MVIRVFERTPTSPLPSNLIGSAFGALCLESDSGPRMYGSEVFGALQSAARRSLRAALTRVYSIRARRCAPRPWQRASRETIRIFRDA